MKKCPDCATHAAEAGKLAAAAVALKLHAAHFWANVPLSELARVVGATEADLAEARRRIRRGEL